MNAQREQQKASMALKKANMKLTYYGTRQPTGHCAVMIKEEHPTTGSPIIYILTHIERHSPDGFQWGYGGSGPADLALSMLTDYCKRTGIDEDIPGEHYQQFKFDVISTASDELSITSDQIKEWLSHVQGKKNTNDS